jgi:hypothetical protein
MTDTTAKFKVAQRRLRAIDRALDTVRDQKFFAMLTNPLAIRELELKEQRDCAQQELAALSLE